MSMSQDREKYQYFHVGLLKNSFALDALWQDALKYHMVDHPSQLIALRLTEYYEMMARGAQPPDAAATPTVTGKRGSREEMTAVSSNGYNGASPLIDHMSTSHPDQEIIVTASPDAEQNADEAAEYWARL
jgi:hypothetical protein